MAGLWILGPKDGAIIMVGEDILVLDQPGGKVRIRLLEECPIEQMLEV